MRIVVVDSDPGRCSDLASLLVGMYDSLAVLPSIELASERLQRMRPHLVLVSLALPRPRIEALLQAIGPLAGESGMAIVGVRGEASSGAPEEGLPAGLDGCLSLPVVDSLAFRQRLVSHCQGARRRGRAVASGS